MGILRPDIIFPAHHRVVTRHSLLIRTPHVRLLSLVIIYDDML